MNKPDVDLSKLSIGKIFQIDPLGNEDIQVKFGGDFLISTDYTEDFVEGYMANVYEVGLVPRMKGLSFLRVQWKHLECVGSVHWFKQGDKDGQTVSN